MKLATSTDALPRDNCLVVAAATPVDPDFAPDIDLLVAHCRMLLGAGCDGIGLFGTTGEGPEFSIRQRQSTLDALLAAGIPASRLIVSATALPLPDTVELARHAMQAGADSVLLMPPCVYRSGLTDEGTFRFYATFIERFGGEELRLCLYHFPDICGAPLRPRMIRRLEEHFPGVVTGIKDSGGDMGFTEALVRAVGHLGVYVGSETHVPQAIAVGARGTICGLANVMPRLMRVMIDQPTVFDMRKVIPQLTSGDLILSRQSFSASIKAVLAGVTGDAGWARMVPPLAEIAQPERGWLVDDFMRWERGLPPAMRSFPDGAPGDSNVLPLRRAF